MRQDLGHEIIVATRAPLCTSRTGDQIDMQWTQAFQNRESLRDPSLKEHLVHGTKPQRARLRQRQQYASRRLVVGQRLLDENMTSSFQRCSDEGDVTFRRSTDMDDLDLMARELPDARSGETTAILIGESTSPSEIFVYHQRRCGTGARQRACVPEAHETGADYCRSHVALSSSHKGLSIAAVSRVEQT